MGVCEGRWEYVRGGGSVRAGRSIWGGGSV